MTGGVPAVSNTAPTLWLELSVTVHDPVPEQAPVQPLKTDEASATAVRVIDVPIAIADWLHVAPHDIEPPEIVPVPVPLLVAVNEYVGGTYEDTSPI